MHRLSPRVSRTSSRRIKSNSQHMEPIETLESRTMLCMYHEMLKNPVVELRPDLLQQALKHQKTALSKGMSPAPSLPGPAADIVWVNRGSSTSDTDGFNATFGTVAPTARAVVDAVISMYERMIGSFNYSDNSANFNLTLSMNGSGF